MDRRAFLASMAAVLAAGVAPARAQAVSFDTLLAEVEADPALVEGGWAYREPSVTRGVGHGTPSKRKLNKAATDLIIAFEIASPKVYEKKYRRPIWPKGQSGVTIGVGYDLRFANRSYIDRDWPNLSAADRDLLATVVTLSGTKARDALPSVQAVDVPWEVARAQFEAFIPYPTKETENAFPNCGVLSDDSFGALVSLIYNRGSSIPRNSKSRREMYEIKQLMAAQQFADIPAQIRSMKRLWTTPDSRGLLIRREAEAVLFERGLAA
jgi:hypothetical protein